MNLWNGIGEPETNLDKKVRVRFRDGSKVLTRVGDLRWTHTNGDGDIMAYEFPMEPTEDTHEMLTFGALGVKQSNPKDLIGSRKAPLSALPFRVLWRVGLAMLEGMCKYGRHNYRVVGVRASVYFDGGMRHLGAWWEGEDIDADSGMNHIDKAISDLITLRDSMLQGNWVDDRPPSAKEDFAYLNAEAARIVDLHADKKPYHFTIKDTA